ncbi:MAG: hypothetical protein AAFQ09_08760 [Pseudomonadota bacterium]
MRFFGMGVVLVALAACGGGSGGGDDEAEIETVTLGQIFGLDTFGQQVRPVDYNAVDDTYTFQDDGDTITITGDPDLDLGTFDGATDGIDHMVLSSRTEDSVATVLKLTSFTATRDPRSAAGALVERTTPVEVPVSGTTTLTGDYVGFITDGGSFQTLAIRVQGNASVTFDFGDNRAQGGITDRVRLGALNTANLGALEDVTFLLSDEGNDRGIFQGDTTGG